MMNPSNIFDKGWKSLKEFKYRRLVDLPIFIFYFGNTLSSCIINNLIIYKKCKLKYNESTCLSLISSHEDETGILEEELQQQATPIIMAKFMIEGSILAILCLFLGPLSNIKGRKPIMFMSEIGHILYFTTILIYIMTGDWDPWYLLIASFIYSISGGASTMVTCSICYITDITETEKLSSRLTRFQGVLLLGILFGNIFSSYFLDIFNYAGVYGVCVVLSIINMCIIIFLEESLKPNSTENEFKILSFMKDLVKSVFRTSCSRRANYRRYIIWLVLTTSALNILGTQGEATVGYLFTREKLKWVLSDYTLNNSFTIIMTVIGQIITILVLQKCLKLSDPLVSMTSFLSSAAKCIVILCAFKTWHMYLASIVSCFGAVSTIVNKALLTKIVDTRETAHIMSVATSIENGVPLFAGVIYTTIYNSSLTTCPECYNWFTLGIFLTNVVLIGVVYILLRIHPIPINDKTITFRQD